MCVNAICRHLWFDRVCVCVCVWSSSKRALTRRCAFSCACMLCTYANGVYCCGRLVLYTVHLNYILHPYNGNNPRAPQSLVDVFCSLSLSFSVVFLFFQLINIIWCFTFTWACICLGIFSYKAARFVVLEYSLFKPSMWHEYRWREKKNCLPMYRKCCCCWFCAKFASYFFGRLLFTLVCWYCYYCSRCWVCCFYLFFISSHSECTFLVCFNVFFFLDSCCWFFSCRVVYFCGFCLLRSSFQQFHVCRWFCYLVDFWFFARLLHFWFVACNEVQRIELVCYLLHFVSPSFLSFFFLNCCCSCFSPCKR